ncbi:hypothetical protein ACIP2X_29410 [Streptomyces sp. NPDC089424]|uniref:hypothetical protein n=1 Tax=Streptomyces sp. NPDC089424 TaxID=3365917 RepID=UPI0037F645A0
MGVFARLFRKSKTTEEKTTEETSTAETSPAEAGTDQPSARPATDEVTEAKASGGTEAGAGTDAAAKTGGEGDAPESVEIPQQQSPGQAADSEADEGART